MELTDIPLPWQQQQWEQLQQTIIKNRLPHALLLSGTQGLGKEYFAKAWAKSLLCQGCSHESPCKSCHLFLNDSHPDLAFLTPEENSKIIKIEQVRRVIDFLSQTSQYGGYKIVIIHPADQMNQASANALLKTLEEPPKHSLLILISAKPSQLPITLRSRCQTIYFKTPPHDLALRWLQKNNQQNGAQVLKLTQGAPLAALALQENELVKQSEELFIDLKSLLLQQGQILALAKKWLNFDIKILLDWVMVWVADLIYQRGQIFPENISINLNKLFELLTIIYDMKRLVERQFNINETLMLETLFLQMTRVE